MPVRYALVLTTAVLFAPSLAFAAEPPITFQTQPFDRLLNELRTATDLVGGERAVKALNTAMKDRLGDKGFEGLDLNKPIVGYVILAPKLEDITAVVAFPVTGEKEFLALCDRVNHDKHKDLGKGLYQLPPLNPQYKARMRFSDQYAYIAYGNDPERALEPKALVSPNKLYDPAETAAFTGKLHFDRITPEVKAALVTMLLDAKKTLLEKVDLNGPDQAAFKPVFGELEKLARRYMLLLGGADTAALRLKLDPATGDVAVEATLTPKPNTELAKQIAARKPSANRFAGLITQDTVAGFHYTAPLFAEEIRTASAAFSEIQQKEMTQNLPDAAKATVEELFKGQARTTKAGEGDWAVALRGPDKDGHFSAVAAMSFEDPSALEKAFKKYMEDDAPLAQFGAFKWDADKAGTVNIHTFKLNGVPLPEAANKLFGDDLTLAFAFAPKGIFLALGPDAIATLKDALKVKPGAAPAFDLVVNPARLAKLVEAAGGGGLIIERALGKDNKLLSATSIRVTSGKDLTVRFAVNLKVIPKAIASLMGGPVID
jgi:hypothetical protein